MKKEKSVVREKITDILKALYNIFIADSDSLGEKIPGLDEIYDDIKKNGSDEDKKIVEALKQSQTRIDDRLFKNSLKVANSHTLNKLAEKGEGEEQEKGEETKKRDEGKERLE